VWVIMLIFVVQVVFTYVGGSLLRTVGLSLHEWFLVLSASSIIVPFDMVRKFVMYQLVGASF